MRRVWVGILLASLPLGVLAQQGGVLRENLPPDNPATVPPAEDSITATPLPPPDQNQAPAPDGPAPDGTAADGAQPLLVPNPLDDLNTGTVAATGKPAQPAQGVPQRGGWVQMGTATLQALDKVNARGDTLTLKVGDSGHFGSLIISVRGCYVRTPDRPADATAYLVIRDQRPDTPGFSGWMVRSAPSMSMLAHPIYDIRVAGCSP